MKYLLLFLLFSATDKDIRKAETKMVESKAQIEKLRLEARIAERKKEEILADLMNQEAKFSSQFSNILSPLLNWPEISFQTRIKSWIDREHGRFILDLTREKLLREPLELIADRELNLRMAAESSVELEQKLRSLESKQSLLKMQVEELKLLQKRSKPSKKKST